MSEYIKSGVYTRNGDELSFNFNTSLSATQKASFVSNVVGVVVGDNYYDFLIDLIFDYEIVEKFTDVDLSDVNGAINQIDAVERFLEETNIVDIVKKNAEFGLVDGLRDSVEKCIEYKTGIHKNVVAESIAKLINTIDKKVSDVDIDSVMEAAKAMSDMSGELTADKILEAYANSDMFKTQHKQVTNKRGKRKTKNGDLKVVEGSNNKLPSNNDSSNGEV